MLAFIKQKILQEVLDIAKKYKLYIKEKEEKMEEKVKEKEEKVEENTQTQADVATSGTSKSKTKTTPKLASTRGLSKVGGLAKASAGPAELQQQQ